MRAPERIHRLLTLVTVLQTGKHFLADDLAAQVRTSRRTLFRDLNLLKQVGIPVKFDPARRTYHIEQSFFLPPVNLSLPEVLGLMMLVHKQASAERLPNFPAIVGAMLKIESTLPREIQEYCGMAVKAVECRPMPSTDAAQVGDTFELAWQATYHREKLRLHYDSFLEREEIDAVVRPYRLTFIGRGWYIVGYSELHNQVRSFKLDRISSIRLTGESFEPDPDFDLARHFGNAWQMIRDGQEHDVRIRFSPRVAGNVEEVLWHHTQQTRRQPDGSLIFEARVDGLREILWWVLGYGKEAVVEQPLELRTMIREHVQEMSREYIARERAAS